MTNQTAMRDILTDAELDAVAGGERSGPCTGGGNYRSCMLDNIPPPVPEPNPLTILGSVLGSLVGIK